MALKVYNTKTKQKEVFSTLEEGRVKMYVCGPTVYDFLHIGNFRGAIFFNLVRNWLEKLGYEVSYLYNYTDVDDKIINRALKENKTWDEIATTYIKEFEKDYSSLNLKPHTKNPKVSESMDFIIDVVAGLIKNKSAYEVSGDVYFNVSAFKTYGGLSNKNIDEMQSGFRIDVDERKKHPADFALWKSAKEGEPSWPSPWGNGRPGWHIECSAMIYAYLGSSIDIHGGGMDLIFPHHENEIAQSEAFTKKPFVKYWMHNNMLELGKQKMSKSLGNITTGRSFLEKYNGEILKYTMLSSHYRSTIDFSEQQVGRAIQTLAKFYSALSLAKKLIEQDGSLQPIPKEFQELINKADLEIERSLNDDFNTPEVLAQLFEVLKAYNNVCRGKGSGASVDEQKAVSELFFYWLRSKTEVMALFQEDPRQYLRVLDDLLLDQKDVKRSYVDELVKARSEARQQKDFTTADKVREQLKELGIVVMDSASGSVWEVEK